MAKDYDVLMSFAKCLIDNGNGTFSLRTNGGSITPGTTVISGGVNTRVLFDDNGVVGEDAGFTYDKTLDALTVAGSVISTNIVASSTTSQPIVYAFPQSDFGKSVQMYHTGAGGGLVGTSSGDFTVFCQTGKSNFVKINNQILVVNAVTTFTAGVDTPAWIHVFSSNAVQSTGGYSHIQVTATRDGSSITDQSNGLFVNATGDYVWAAHLNLTSASDNSFGFVVGNHGTNSVAGVFYTDNSTTNTGVMINTGVSGALNMLQFRNDYHPTTGPTGTTFTGKYISFQSGTTEHSYIDYRGTMKLGGITGVPVLTLGKGEAGVDYQFLKVDGETYDLNGTWYEDEASLVLTSSLTQGNSSLIVGSMSTALFTILGGLVTGELTSAFGVSGNIFGVGFIESRSVFADGSIMGLITNDGTNMQANEPIGVYTFGGCCGSQLPSGADIAGLAYANWTDTAGTPTSTPGLILIRTQTTNVADIMTPRASFSELGTRVQLGATSLWSKVGGYISDTFTDSTVGGAEADIYTYTTPANSIARNGDKFIASYGGNFVTVGTELTQLKVYFGGTAIWDSTGVAPATGTTSWRVYVEIIRVSSTVVRYTVSLNTTGASGFVYAKSGELTGLTLSNTNVLKITGTSSGVGSGSGDIVGKMGSVAWFGAA